MSFVNIYKKVSKYPFSISFNLLLSGWSIIIIGIAFWSYQSISSETLLLARKEAYKGYEKDVAFRSWATMHGGVYVPITNETQPNPYLSGIPERDISTPANKKLTLMNPAYMTRQVHELSFKKLGILGHITSMNPIRKENIADKWELEALRSFEKGVREFSGFDFINNEKYFRYMAPLITEKGCLKCHSVQGFKEGDIRGGISSSVPWNVYEASIYTQTIEIIIRYGLIWIIGFIGIMKVKKNFIIYLTRRDLYEEEMKILNDELRVSKYQIEENLLQKNNLIEELTNAREKLEKINSEKDKFFSIIAHDLKSPFSGFIGLTEIMAEDIDTFSKDELSQLSKEMHSNAKNLFKLLSNLLDWARMQQGSVSFNPIKLLLLKEVSNNVNLLIKRGEQKGIEIMLEVPEYQEVYADEAMLNSILRNLLSNAVKFTNQGGKIIVRAVERVNNLVEISVTDSGVGISSELLSKLFKIEEKVGRKGTEGEASTGIGLLLCKEFVEKHGGNIWVESEEEKGSTFYFTLQAS